MNVNDIRDRILDISHDEAAPDTDLQAKSLRWLNSAYHELVDEAMPYLERYLQTTEVVTTTDGTTNLAADVYRIIRVVDTTNGRLLAEVAQSDVLDMDPDRSATGAPLRLWVDGSTLTVHPKSDITLEVLYLPNVADLVADGTEASILLPRQFHHALVWGGLVWSAVYERGFGTQADLQLFQQKWEEAKRNVKLSLAARPSGQMRVQSYDVA